MHGNRLGLVAAVPFVSHNLAVSELDNTALHLVDDSGIVGSHDHGCAAEIDALQERHDSRARCRVKVSRRLIGEQHRRFVDDRPGNSHALLLATRELMRETARLAAEPHHLEHVRNCFLNETFALADHLQSESHVVENRFLRQEPEVLKHHAQVAAKVRHLAVRQSVQVLTEHVNVAGRGLLLPKHQPQKARLAGARGANEEHELALQNLHADRIESWTGVSCIGLGDRIKPNHDSQSLSR